MVTWAGVDRVLMNDYRKIDLKMHRELSNIFKRSQIEVSEIPYAPDLRVREIPSAVGTYANLLALSAVVLMPVYGISTDQKAFAAIEAEFIDRPVVPIAASSIAREGGSIHCVTWDWHRVPGG